MRLQTCITLVIIFLNLSTAFAQLNFDLKQSLDFIGSPTIEVINAMERIGYNPVEINKTEGKLQKKAWNGAFNFEYYSSDGLMTIFTFNEHIMYARDILEFYKFLGYTMGEAMGIISLTSPDGKVNVIIETNSNSNEVRVGVSLHPRYKGKISQYNSEKSKKAAASTPFQGTRYYYGPSPVDKSFIRVVTITENKITLKMVPPVGSEFYKDWLKDKWVGTQSGYLKNGILYREDGSEWYTSFFVDGEYAERVAGDTDSGFVTVKMNRLSNMKLLPKF